MSSIAVGGIVVAFITAVAAILVALIGRSQNKLTAGNSAGELALRLAQNSQLQIEALQEELREIKQRMVVFREAWREHEKWDDARDEEMELVSPGSTARLPDRPKVIID